eukprot:134264-Chlamydomonas_euryale.AAC.2
MSRAAPPRALNPTQSSRRAAVVALIPHLIRPRRVARCCAAPQVRAGVCKSRCAGAIGSGEAAVERIAPQPAWPSRNCPTPPPTAAVSPFPVARAASNLNPRRGGDPGLFLTQDQGKSRFLPGARVRRPARVAGRVLVLLPDLQSHRVMWVLSARPFNS